MPPASNPGLVVRWFVADLVPWWTGQAADAEAGGFFDALGADGTPIVTGPKTTLAQARTLFTLSHLALFAGDSRFSEAAGTAHQFLNAHLFDPARGGHVRAVARDGAPTGNAADLVARSYDQTFVLLALATYERLAPEAGTAAALDACWAFIAERLTDPATGLLLEDDGVRDPAAPDAPLRAQNPHMHLFEALLQAFEMTGAPVWMERAEPLLELSLRHFCDAETGSIAEFRAPGLGSLPRRLGTRREPGHQCEWAWLLHRYARLGGTADVLPVAERLMDFALRHGFCDAGPMRGAVRDAVAADGSILENTFLLWPQTEAAKAFAARFERSGDEVEAERARATLALLFERYFVRQRAWCNQLDAEARVLQPEALSRLLYHLALAVTEGARVGLWPAGTAN